MTNYKASFKTKLTSKGYIAMHELGLISYLNASHVKTLKEKTQTDCSDELGKSAS